MAPAAGTPPTPMSSANGSPNSDISPADHRAATPSQPFPSPSLLPSSPLPPPSLSSGGASLHRLGISPFAQRPPQRRADASNSSQDDARDSRDVLLQRLADLMERVGDSHLGDDAVSEMHRRVDEMEDVARTTSPRGEKKSHSHPRPNTLPVEPRPNIWGTPSAILRPSFSDPAPFETTPGLPMLRPPPLHRHSVSEPIDDISLQLPALVQMRPGTREKMEAARRAEEAVRIAREAEQLNQHLATLITRLRARQEESEHIHALLIEKAEKAAQRIIVLEEQVQDLTSSLKESNTDLANLRIALKAIELQLPPPQDLDEDLRRSIQNWKADWRRRKEARASRHRLAHLESSLLSSPGTPW